MNSLKLIYLVLDGAAGDPSLGTTAYLSASKPNLDYLARNGRCGLVYTIGQGIPPESDAAVLSLLSYDPEIDYPGRGPIEALGVGLSLEEGKEVAFRGNFATVDPILKVILDRRAGRVFTPYEAKELARAIDGMKLREGYVRVKESVGHRVVVVIGSEKHKLGDQVGNTDPGYLRKGKISVSASKFDNRVSPCIPMTSREEDKITCELVNEFTERAIGVLDRHPINLMRKSQGLPPANAILLRDGGGRNPNLKALSSKFTGLSFTALVEMPVEIGIARAARMNVEVLPPPGSSRRDEEYRLRAEKTINAIERSDVVYVHLKGPDEPGHDGNLKLKAKIIEEIDKFFIKELLERISWSNTAVLVTSDHATPCQLKSHSDAPVPFLLYHLDIKPDRLKSFDEVECRKGSFGVIEKGSQLLPMILKELQMIK